MINSNSIIIDDTTLCEKSATARLLDNSGIQEIECGIPAICQIDKAVNQVAV